MRVTTDDTAKRMSCVVNIHPDKVVVTCTPLVPDVTKEELYDREAVLLMEVGPKVIALMNSLGAGWRVKDMSIVRDHEDAVNPDD